MARPTSRHPTELELEILQVLWNQGPLSGREIRDVIQTNRDLTYQSIMTILGIMVDKGYVTRKKTGGSYAYRARVTQQATSKRMMRDLVDRLFHGSAATAMLNLLETSDLSDDELEQLTEFVSRKKKE